MAILYEGRVYEPARWGARRAKVAVISNRDDVRCVPTGQRGETLALGGGRVNETLGRHAGRGVPLLPTGMTWVLALVGANTVSRGTHF